MLELLSLDVISVIRLVTAGIIWQFHHTRQKLIPVQKVLMAGL